MRLEDGWFRSDEVLATVAKDWTDSNQHLNMGYYLVAFDFQTDRLWAELGLGRPLRARGLTTFAVEAWLDYQREMLEGDTIGAESRVLDYDPKRLMVEHRMFHHGQGWTSSAHEVLYLCVDVASRKVSGWPDDVLARLAEVTTDVAPRRLSMKRRP